MHWQDQVTPAAVCGLKHGGCEIYESCNLILKMNVQARVQKLLHQGLWVSACTAIVETKRKLIPLQIYFIITSSNKGKQTNMQVKISYNTL